jgi:hypothetical protein
MKTFLSFIVLIAASAQGLVAQTTTLVFAAVAGSSDGFRQQDIPILAGETFEVLTWAYNDYNVLLNTDGATVVSNTLPNGKLVVAGPKTLTLLVDERADFLVTYKLTPDLPMATQNVASQAVVIPANAPAPVDVIFESSTDLINWTAAVAGSYSPSTPKRFFRVRLVSQ